MNSLEPTQVVIVLVSLILAPHIAEVVAPYTVIIIASCVGAGWSLGNTEKLSRWQALWFFCRISTTAMILTVFVASIISNKLGYTEARWLLAPVALFIGIIGDEWGNLSNWAANKLKNFLSNFKDN